MDKTMKIDAIVVLYHPQEKIVENIKSYIKDVEKLYIVDNSEDKNIILINEMKAISQKCNYIDNNGNQGIAHALNVGAKLAIENGADWLLTMDQDSRFEDDNLKNLIQCASLCDNFVGIVSPLHVLEHSISRPVKSTKISETLIVMTSGNLLNLDIYQKVGCFIEKLFIDSVDHEYCLRLRHNGYKVVVCEFALLEHALGDLKEIKLGFKNIRYSNHSALRRYYITRNRFYLLQKYFWEFPAVGFRIIKWIIFEWIKIIVLEKDKTAKSRATIEGIRDFYRGKYGKYRS